MRLTLSLAAALLLLGAGCSANMNTNTSTRSDDADDTPVVSASTTGSGTACTMEAKACPDGSFVGRTGPNCEFAACPTPAAPTSTAPTSTTKADDKKPATTTPPTGPKTYTMADVATQVKAGKCWTVINAKVYDLTSWINKHPGGEAAIKSLCGIDGTAGFTRMHGGDAKPEAVLATYLVGSLK